MVEVCQLWEVSQLKVVDLPVVQLWEAATVVGPLPDDKH